MLCAAYLKGLHWSTILLTLAFMYVFFLRKWSLKKIASFFVVMLILFITMVRFENFLKLAVGEEGSFFTIGVVRTVFVIVTAIVLLYHAAVKE